MTAEDGLQRAIERSARASIIALGRAEEAVRGAQFNMAKVLRALAQTERATAMALARELGGHGIASLRAFEAELDPATTEDSANGASARTNMAEIARKPVESLQGNPDVSENDVAQILWGCHLCGWVGEAQRPDACPTCGAPSPDFELFAPFHMGTPECLGRLTPMEVIATLGELPAHVETILAAIDAGNLWQSTRDDEWSPVERLAHLIETDMLSHERTAVMLDRPGAQTNWNVMPWRLHESKGYEASSKAEPLARALAARERVREVAGGLTTRDWTRRTNVRSAIAKMLDLRTWFANHDPGHLEQLRQLSTGER